MYNPDTGIYTIEPKMLVNTREFSRTAQYFEKHGFYTKLHPRWDEAEYKAFWREERRRRKEGYSVGGVHITGDHYNFLNFTRIQRTFGITISDIGVGTSKHTADKREGFPDFWDGHYEMSHARKTAEDFGLHFIGGKSRRKGFSWWGGAEGANSAELNRGRTVVYGAFDSKFITQGDAIFAMARAQLDFYNQYTAFFHNRLINKPDEIKLGYRLRGKPEDYGSKARLIAVSFKNNPDAVRGKDARRVFLEELGTFPNLSEVLDATLNTLKSGALITGQIAAWGTGGSDEADWKAFEEIYFNPKSYGFLAFDNQWDEGARGTVCGYYFPYKQNLEPFMDADGNSLKEESIDYIEADRAEAKKNSKSLKDYLRKVSEEANCPAESFGRSSRSIFASATLDDHTSYLARTMVGVNSARCGILERDLVTGGIKLTTNQELEALGRFKDIHQPLNEYPLVGTNVDYQGCYVEWYAPHLVGGKVPKHLYRVWVDTFGQDKDKEHVQLRDSLGAIYVYERTNTLTESKGDVLVAEWVGRPSTLDEFNEIALRIGERFGGSQENPGIIMFENDRGTLKQYAEKKKKLYLLAGEPDLLFKQEVSYKKVGREFGISMTGDRPSVGALMAKDWLYAKRGETTDGEPILNLHLTKSLGLCRELNRWNKKGNFDRASAIFVGMFDKDEQTFKEIEVAEPTYERGSFLNRRLYK